MATLIFDCETVGALSELSNPDLLTVTKYAVRREMDVAKYAATCPALARVVLVGMLNPDTGVRRVAYDRSLVDIGSALDIGAEPVGCDGETDLVAHVHGLMTFYNIIVSFNGSSFDVPLLLLRAMRHGLMPAPILVRAAKQKPWDDSPHIDVMNVLSFGSRFNAYPLAVYGLGLGVGSPKTHGDGSSVADLVASRDGVGLATYCLGDVDVTHALAVKAGVLKPAHAKAA